MKGYDDKDLVIVATLLLGIVSVICLQEPNQIVSNIVTGLFGIAVGKKL